MTGPTPDELRRVRARHMLTQTEAAAIVCVSPRAWQRWEATGTTAREMPPGLWRLLLLWLDEPDPYKDSAPP